MFDNEHMQLTEIILLLPKLIIVILNFTLVSLLSQHLEKRALLRSKFVVLFDSGMSEYY